MDFSAEPRVILSGLHVANEPIGIYPKPALLPGALFIRLTAIYTVLLFHLKILASTQLNVR